MRPRIFCLVAQAEGFATHPATRCVPAGVPSNIVGLRLKTICMGSATVNDFRSLLHRLSNSSPSGYLITFYRSSFVNCHCSHVYCESLRKRCNRDWNNVNDLGGEPASQPHSYYYQTLPYWIYSAPCSWHKSEHLCEKVILSFEFIALSAFHCVYVQSLHVSLTLSDDPATWTLICKQVAVTCYASIKQFIKNCSVCILTIYFPHAGPRPSPARPKSCPQSQQQQNTHTHTNLHH